MITMMKQNAVCLTVLTIVFVIYLLGHVSVPTQVNDNHEELFKKQLEMLMDIKLEPSSTTLLSLEKLLMDTQKQVVELQKEIRKMNSALVKHSSSIPSVICSCINNSTSSESMVERQHDRPPLKPEKLPAQEKPNFDLATKYINDLPTDPCVEIDVEPIYSEGADPSTASGAFVYLAPPKVHERYIKRIHLLSFSIQRIEAFYHRQLKLYRIVCASYFSHRNQEEGKIVYHYPILIFHEDFEEPEIQYLRSQMMDPNFPLIFEKVDFNSSLYYPACAENTDFEEASCGTEVGYRKMCRFWSGIMQNLPIMEQFDYYWRMDDDSSILGPVEKDLFKYMEDEKLAYIYEISVTEEQGQSQHDLTKLYLKNVGREYPRRDWPGLAWGDNQAIYNNFHVSKLDMWRSKTWSDYFEFMEKQQCGFFHQCWGDASWHTNFLFVAAKPKETERITGEVLPYSHNFHLVYGSAFAYEPNHVAWMRPLCKNVL